MKEEINSFKHVLGHIPKIICGYLTDADSIFLGGILSSVVNFTAFKSVGAQKTQ